jgi:ribose 5-phosphate isomerase B
MKVFIGSDHAGFEYKEVLVRFFLEKGIDFVDVGPSSSASVDYPDYAHQVGAALENQTATYGILICGSGNGVCMTANKYPKVRAALAWNPEIARLARQHNDANALCLPARFVSQEDALEMVSVFLHEPFEGGRHQNRVEKVSKKLC